METIQINDTTRVIIEPDLDAQNPHDDWNHVVVYSFRRASNSRLITDSSDDYLTKAFDHFLEAFDNEDKALYALKRYAEWGNDDRHIEIHYHSGYSQGDWAYFLFIMPKEEANYKYPEEYFMWRQGDVFGVTVENLSDCGHWEEIEDGTLWGIYAEYGDTATIIETVKDYGLV